MYKKNYIQIIKQETFSLTHYNNIKKNHSEYKEASLQLPFAG